MCRFSTRPKPCWESVRLTPLLSWLSWLLCYCHANTTFRMYVSEDVSWQLTVTFTFRSLLVKLKECVTVLIQCNNTLQYNKSTCHVFILQVFSRTHICFTYTPSCCGHALCLCTYLLFSVSLAYVIEILSTLMFGPGIEFRWTGGDFSAPVQTGSKAHTASYTISTGSLSRG
jgi:hypothetical protein